MLFRSARFPLADKRVSENRRSPSLTFFESASGGGGIGVIGSSGKGVAQDGRVSGAACNVAALASRSPRQTASGQLRPTFTIRPTFARLAAARKKRRRREAGDNRPAIRNNPLPRSLFCAVARHRGASRSSAVVVSKFNSDRTANC